MKCWIFLLFIVYQSLAFAQTSQNISLFGQLDPEPIHYAGSWAYADTLGAEYALLGAYNGTSIIAIDDSTNIYQAAWIPGPASNWREFTVIGDYAFVVTEGDSGDTGMQVIFLGSLPAAAPQITTFDSTFSTAHILEKDILGNRDYVYVCGTDAGNGGVHIIDVSDPANPVEISTYAPTYAHDCHVRGDTMYVAALYDAWVDVVDISDKANPVRIAQILSPSNGYTHSAWTTRDNTHLVVTEEIDGLPALIYDIRDLNNISEVATWTANPISLVHNCYIRGDFGFISHNTEGLRVLDLRKPDVPVEVGHYDTWSGPSGGFHGLWSACPFLPSGKIIGGNREDGLYVWRFQETYAGRIYGTVTDSLTQFPLVNAAIRIVQSNDSTRSLTDGSYKFGAVPSGGNNYTVTYSHPGYLSKSINTPLNGQDSLWFAVELVPVGTGVGADPNPSDWALIAGPEAGELQVETPPTLLPGTRTLHLYDLQGRRLILPQTLQTGHMRLQIPHLSSGGLIYEIRQGNNRLKTGRLLWLDR